MVETRSPKGGKQAQDPSPVVIGGCFLQCRYSGFNFCPTYFLFRYFKIVNPLGIVEATNKEFPTFSDPEIFFSQIVG